MNVAFQLDASMFNCLDGSVFAQPGALGRRHAVVAKNVAQQMPRQGKKNNAMMAVPVKNDKDHGRPARGERAEVRHAPPGWWSLATQRSLLPGWHGVKHNLSETSA